MGLPATLTLEGVVIDGSNISPMLVDYPGELPPEGLPGVMARCMHGCGGYAFLTLVPCSAPESGPETD